MFCKLTQTFSRCFKNVILFAGILIVLRGAAYTIVTMVTAKYAKEDKDVRLLLGEGK